ncbi:hypothetical protein GTH32_16030 [Alteromonas sp. 345S023]|uniref:HmuY protein n=1 Tax=Alteromonas profundi TaxID=2696062 RepID=A0A7X5LNP8_9ALTE|nr:HmuY family protein [Alteromonas profundi]NDV92683.1 hypothetical protein [Alteromonas profundi]
MKHTQLAFLIALSLGLAACGGSSDDTPVNVDTGVGVDDGTEDTGDETQGSTDEPNDEGTIYGPFSTGSTAEPVAVYFDLDTQSQITLTEEEAAVNTQWDIGFQRTNVFLNTHQEAPVSLYFTGNNADFFDDEGNAIADSFLNATADSELDDYLTVTASDIPDDAEFVSDSETQVIGTTFYNYDTTTHVVSAADDVYYIVSSDDNYTKFHVTDIVTEGYGMGELTLNVMHQSVLDGQTEFAEAVAVSANLVGCTEAAYIDFDLQQTVTASDDWDISIPCSDGAGEFAINLADDASVLRTDAQTYAGVDDAAAAFYGFSSETVSAYAISENNWYYYDSSSHLLYSQFGVYLIKAGDTVFKMQITSYYDEAGTSGNYSFRSDALTAE